MERLQKLADMKGLTLVNEQWLVDRIVEGEQVLVPDKGAKLAASASGSAPAAAKTVAHTATTAMALASSTEGDGIRGLTFTITGTVQNIIVW
jgi:hypothetical protein